jgi:hypothetical protein
MASTNVINTVAPNLPVAPAVYSQQFEHQFSNALRLYFVTVDNFTSQVVPAIQSTNVTAWLGL